MTRLPLIAAAALLAWGPLPAQDLALRAGTLLDGNGKVAKNTVLLVSKGKIRARGKDLPLPPGVEVLDARDLWVTPALVDCGSSLGLPRPNMNEEDREVEPALRAADALDLTDPGFKRALASGVGTICVLPGSRDVISGLAAIVRFTGKKGAPRVVSPAAALVAAMGRDPVAGNTRNPASHYFRRPTTRMGTVWLFRKAFYDARAAGPNAKDPGIRILRRALSGKLPLRILARPEFDIRTALDLAAEFHLRIAALDEAQEAWRVAPLLAKAKVPAAAAPPSRVSRTDMVEQEWNFLSRIFRAGIPAAIQTGRAPAGRALIEEARIALRLGLDRAAAFRAVTSIPARILGMEKEIGTLEKGKDADLVLWKGDPFGPAGRVVCVFCKGRLVFGKPPSRKEGSK
ncbi:MAG TPA: hypothetical protein ENJ97_03765 [Planctomycetes bacterium]|nr:hypothetical protein [Planctomycetota bacterium]